MGLITCRLAAAALVALAMALGIAVPGGDARSPAEGSRTRGVDPAARPDRAAVLASPVGAARRHGITPLTLRPIHFEPNLGQAASDVRFVARGAGYVLLLAADEAVFVLPRASAAPPSEAGDTAAGSIPGLSATLRLKLVGADLHAVGLGVDELPGKVNYLFGNDPRAWRTDVPTYAKVRVSNVYPDVDLVYYGNEGELEFDMVLAPGADPSMIVLSMEGAEQLVLDTQGDLVIGLGAGEMRMRRPHAYQRTADGPRAVAVEYVIAPDSTVSFALGPHDPLLALVIDPVLSYSTFVNGTAFAPGVSGGHGIAVDGAGSAYVIGTTFGFGPTAGAFQTPTTSGGADVSITKLDPSGSRVVYSTFFGGSNNDFPVAVAVDGAGQAHITGRTLSPNFPTRNAIQSTLRSGENGFVVKLNATGSDLVYSTFLGGTGTGGDRGLALGVDGLGAAYVAGVTSSNDFPVTTGAFQAACVQAAGRCSNDAFVTKLGPTGALVYSTFLGGSLTDQAHAIAVDTTGAAYVAGWTQSQNFPVTASGLDTTANGATDAFVTKLSPTGSTLDYSTYLGGGGTDEAYGIAIDAAGQAFVTGWTFSASFPLAGSLHPLRVVGNSDAFVARLGAGGGALIWSTLLGGTNGEHSQDADVAVDARGNAYVVGTTTSTDFPTAAPIQASSGGPPDAYLARLDTVPCTGTAALCPRLAFATYLGGSRSDAAFGVAVDASGAAYVTGTTNSTNFPTTTGAFQTALSGQGLFVAKISEVAPTTTSLSSSANPSVFGQPVTLTATVSSAAGTPTGAVTFKEAALVLGTATLAGGTATLTVATLAVGSHGLTAEYGGGASFLASVSPALTQVVNRAATTVALSSSANPSVFGQPVTFSATVSAVTPGAGTPGGSISFLDGAITLGTVPLIGGAAAFATDRLGVGSHAMTAAYAGDLAFAGSLSAPLSQTVDQAITTATLTSDPNPSYLGQPVIFTATVSAVAPGGGTPTGTVTFRDGAAPLADVPLSGGRATFVTAALLLGRHTITAAYGGDASFTPFGAPPVFHDVDRVPTAMTLVSSANPSVFGQAVTLTATVDPVAPGAGTPSGSIRFLNGAVALGTSMLDATGRATLTAAALAVGTHGLSAEYSGDATFRPSSATLSQTVVRAGTTTTLTSNANPSRVNEPLSLTATVAPVAPGAGIPSGNVTFLDGGVPINTAALDASGRVILSLGAVGGTHMFTAEYAGDARFAASVSPPLTQVVVRAETTTTVTSGADPAVFGQRVTFTAAVSAFGYPTAPTGVVTFKDGAVTLGTATLDAAGRASLTAGPFTVGTHFVTAEYTGTPDTFAPSTSSPLSQIVDPAATSSVLTSSATPSVVGQFVTFTATVSPVAPGAGTPRGTVAFLDGGIRLGTGSLNGGVATLTSSALAVGTHTVSAEYGGDGNFRPSVSPDLSQVVNRAATATTIASSPNLSVFGQPLTFTATVSPVAPGAGTPLGSVAFSAGGATLGTATLSGGVATFATSALAVGTVRVAAEYSGDESFTASSAVLDHEVGRASTTITLTSDPNPSVVRRPVTFTATVRPVAPGAGTPSGSVAFREGATTLGTASLSGGVATFTTSALAVGAHSVAAEYGGDGSFAASTSGTLTQVVDVPPPLVISVVEAIAVGDSIRVVPPRVIAVVEAVAVRDSVRVLPAALVRADEVVRVDDRIGVSLSPLLRSGEPIQVVDSVSVVITNPVPRIAGLGRTTATAGDPSFLLTVDGSDFVRGSTVRWAGANRVTTFISGRRLSAEIPASDLATGQDIVVAEVTVFTPAPGGGTSNVLAFTVVSALVAGVESTIVRPGETATASIATGALAATLTNSGATRGAATLTVAAYESNPATRVFDVGGSFFDLRVVGADPSDTLTARFYYDRGVTGEAEAVLELLYFDGVDWRRVLGSGGTVPVKNRTDDLEGTTSGGRFSVRFDDTSSPKITELTGTVFGALVVDTSSPVIEVTVTPTPNPAGWHRGDVTVAWRVGDPESGVASSAGCGTAVLANETDGTTVTCRAMNGAGMTSEVSTVIRIDRTPPEAALTLDPRTFDLAVLGRDALSGVPAGPHAPSSITRVRDDDDDDDDDDEDAEDGASELRTYRIEDLAGNTLEVVAHVRRHGHELKARVVGLAYGASRVPVARNRASFEWAARDGALRELAQRIEVAAQAARPEKQDVHAHFNAKKDETTVRTKEPGDGERRVFPGLRLLHLASDRGELAVMWQASP